MLPTRRLVAEPVHGGRNGRCGRTEKLVGFLRTLCCCNALRFDLATTSGPPHELNLPINVKVGTLS